MRAVAGWTWSEIGAGMREAATHEAGHAVLGEILGMPPARLEITGGGEGVCWYARRSHLPWVRIAVAAAGHGAVLAIRGRADVSFQDRVDNAGELERLGADDGAGAAVRVERGLWPVFTLPAVRRAVRAVARVLAEQGGELNRAGFKYAAGSAIRSRALRRRVRLFCREAVLRVVLREFNR